MSAVADPGGRLQALARACHARAVRCLFAWLMVGWLAGCAGVKDMSQGAASANDGASAGPKEPSAAEVSDASAPDGEAGREAVERRDDSAPASADAAGRPDAAAPTPAQAQPTAPLKVAPARLIGRKQAEIEAQLGALRVIEGWARPADEALALQFRGGRCVGLRGHVPEDMDCAAVATWLGFDAATYPLRRSDRCEWPGISPKHRLAEGVAGSYVLATREYALTLRR